MSYRILIHEDADIASAGRFWLEGPGADRERFMKPILKRHNPETVRKNVGEDYHGCLVIRVKRGAELYQKLAGWTQGAMSAQVICDVG